MKILLFGADGQVGWQLRRSLAPLGEVVVAGRDGAAGLCGDLLRPEGLARTVAEVRPAVVVNAAAYTAVDRAEEDREAAFAVNSAACEALAQATRQTGSWLVHYSSDYVYDGRGDRPWREQDATAPLGVYGQSKLAGDQAILRLNPLHLVLRTSWVFDTWGQNFAKSILKAAAQKEELSVVADQWGSPTRAALIADVTAHVVRDVFRASDPQPLAGLYHVAASGYTTWHEYACLLLAEAHAAGMELRATAGKVRALASSDYPVRAARPLNSRLDTALLRQRFGISLPAWQDGVRAVAAELAHHHRMNLAPKA